MILPRKMECAKTVVVVLACGLLLVTAQTEDPAVCRAAEKCGKCQSAGAHCTWCSDTGFNSTRCDTRQNLQAAGCGTITTVTDAHVRVRDAEEISNSTFVSPQRVTASLFNRRPATFTVKLRVPPGNSRRRKVTLRARQLPSNLDISISSECPGSRGSGSRSTCPISGPGTEVEFQVRLMMTQCGDDFTTRLRLKASGIPGNVQVDVLNRCTCPCEFYSVWASSEPDEHCSDNGEVLCGLCHCYPGYNGERCECRRNDMGCRHRSSDQEVCSGHGDCVCGSCRCQPLPNPTTTASRYYGRYCECDDSACPLYAGQLCGGEDRGRCNCGQCVCESGFSGQGCEISESADNCLASNGMLCNGRGMCMHGRCQCEGVWRGPTCEDCPTCPGRCRDLMSCVQCTVFSSGPYSPDECESHCAPLDITVVPDVDDTDLGTTICRMRDEGSGMMKYRYVYSEDGSMVILVSILNSYNTSSVSV